MSKSPSHRLKRLVTKAAQGKHGGMYRKSLARELRNDRVAEGVTGVRALKTDKKLRKMVGSFGSTIKTKYRKILAGMGPKKTYPSHLKVGKRNRVIGLGRDK